LGTPKLWLWGTSIIAVALLVLIGYSVRLTSQATFCESCHAMSQAKQSWQSSTHDKISCVSCHRLSLLEKGGMAYQYFTGDNLNFAKQGVQCRSCHREARVITPSEDLRIPHSFHLEQNIACANCHPGAGHLSSATTKSRITASYPTQVMALCLRCHYQKKGTLSCRSCHQRPQVTLPHLQPDWGTSHGISAMEDLSKCNTCHQYTLFLDESRSNSTVMFLSSPAAYCQDNALCANCHQRRPPSHGSYFLHDHPQLAIERENSCEVCHKWDFPLPVEKVPALYCQQCHVYRGWVPLPYGQLQQPNK
jgi:hypothetical protein